MIVQVDEGAVFQKSTGESEGYDVCAMEDAVIVPGNKVLISTGVKVQFPKTKFGLLTHRSSFASKTSGQILTGTIDNDYRGYIKMNVLNSGTKALVIKKGDLIGQLLLLDRKTKKMVITFGTVTSDTERGTKGFGEATK